MEKKERCFRQADSRHMREELRRLVEYHVYLERYVAKTFNKLRSNTFAIGLVSSEGALLDLYPHDKTAQENLFHGEIQVSDLWCGIGHNAVSEGLKVRRSRMSVGAENEADILKQYAVYFAIMNMNDIYEPYALQPPFGIVILTPLGYASDVFFAMSVGIAHDLMLNVQFKSTSVKFYERSGKGVLVVDSMMAEETLITYCNEELLRILDVPAADLRYQPVGKLINPLPDNTKFWEIVEECKVVSNEPMRLRVGGSEVECLVTTDAYKQPSIKSTGVIFYLTTQRKISEELSEKMANGAVKTFDDIIGGDHSLKNMIERAKRMALTDSNIMILGESGTGKDVLAQAIHNGSQRRRKPFIALNCGAMPKDLIESELFGYEAGAFTGAKKNGNMGKFELAMGGTIFLDEIGEMPLDLQAKLLRVVEQKQLMRLGGSRLITVDVKIIAATNADIWEMIEKKQFRADLFYRLSTMRLNLMPLRERKGDIIPLCEYFIRRISKRIGKDNIMRLTDESKALLLSMDWLGNIRELQNLIECIVQLYPGDLILPQYILENTMSYQRPAALEMRAAPPAARERERLPEPPLPRLGAVTREELENALEVCGQNRTKAAKYLGISRRTIYRKLEEYALSNENQASLKK